jgi:hypothetical protein
MIQYAGLRCRPGPGQLPGVAEVERDRGRAGGKGVLVQRAGHVVYNSEPVEQPPRPVVLSYVK